MPPHCNSFRLSLRTGCPHFRRHRWFSRRNTRARTPEPRFEHRVINQCRVHAYKRILLENGVQYEEHTTAVTIEVATYQAVIYESELESLGAPVSDILSDAEGRLLTWILLNAQEVPTVSTVKVSLPVNIPC